MKIKNPFKMLARLVVKAWAKYTFDKVRRTADERHAREGVMIYVVAQPFKPTILTTYNKLRFKIEKHEVWGYHGRLLSLQGLKNGCYYHTPDTAGNQAMSEKDIEIRRNYFIRERLAKAQLL